MFFMTCRSKIRFMLIGIALLYACALRAQDRQQLASIGNLALTGGDTLRDCRIGYRTFGRPNADTSNAVMYTTWFGGTSQQLGSLIGPGRLVDSTKYFVIAIDALGNGVSTSPSNSAEQPDAQFPRITIRDMVNSQHALLTRMLGIRHLHAAIGGSMGSMQLFEWLAAYPGFISQAVPYVCTPRLSTWDLLYFNTELQMIEAGRKAKMPERDIYQSINMLTAMVAESPASMDRKKTRAEFPAYLKSFEKEEPAVFTLWNFEAQLRAMIGHDISRGFGGSMEKAAQAVKQAEVFIIVSESDHIIFPGPALEFAPMIGARTLILKGDGGHMAVGQQMKTCSTAIENFLH